jgi:hypothetical protein
VTTVTLVTPPLVASLLERLQHQRVLDAATAKLLRRLLTRDLRPAVAA